jgi:hypothetical protein
VHRQVAARRPATAPASDGQFNTAKGSPQPNGVWTDPDFDPSAQTYYYVRVLQLPTARWTLFDEIREGVEYPEGVKMQVVERAWGSPIWYEAD